MLLTNTNQDTDYDKLVNIFYSDKKGQSTPLTQIQLGYVETLSGSINPHMQIWAASTSDLPDGISSLINITYAATDVGEVFTQQLNIPVVAQGPKPTPPAPPKPYASPSGFSDDIANFVAAKSGSEAAIAKPVSYTHLTLPTKRIV